MKLIISPCKRIKIQKLIVKSEPQEYENTDGEIYEKELYELDKLSLDESHKYLYKR